MEPFPFSEDNNKEVFRVDEETRLQMEEAEARATIDFLDGYRQGHEEGFQQGIQAGWIRGRDDVLHQLRRYGQHTYDPDVQQAIDEITGDS